MHAYLDGALDALYEDDALPDAMTPADVISHLDACPDCRSRLNIERDIREQAGLVLRAAAPVVHTPPIESLRRARRAPLWVPYAWAASLVMAVGAGWWGSQLARNERMVNESAQSSTMNARAADTAPPAAPVPSPAPIAGTQPQESAPQQEQAPTGAESRPAAPEPQTAKITTPPPTVASEATLGAADARRGRVAGAPPLQTRQQTLDTIAGRARSDFVGRAAEAALTSPPAAVTPLQRFLNSLRIMHAQGFSWRAATAADSIDAFGIDGALDTRIEVAVAPDIGEVVRVRQRLTDGRDIEFVQWREPRAAPLREERAANAPNSILNARSLDDGSHEIIVRPPNSDTFVAMHLTGADALTLAQRITRIPR